MAIKGKGKTKARTVARAPRREPVAVPIPFFRRRWVQVIAAIILGMGIVLFIGWVRAELRSSADEERQAEQLALRTAAVQAWRSQLEAHITSVGTLQDPVEPIVAQDVKEVVRKLENGMKTSLTPGELRTTAEELAAAAAALDDFDLAGTLADQGFTANQVDAIVTSRLEIVEALRQYARAATIAAVALETEDEDLKADLVATASELSDSATELLSDGWRKYQLTLSLAGIQPTGGGLLGG